MRTTDGRLSALHAASAERRPSLTVAPVLARSQPGRFLLCLPPMILAPRYLPRLAATIGLFTRYGLADFAKQQGLQGARARARSETSHGRPVAGARGARSASGSSSSGRRTSSSARCCRRDPISCPPTYIRELEKLQDDVDPIPYTEIEQIVEEELGGRISKLFASSMRSRSAAPASARRTPPTLRDGRSVVVKVQRPDIRDRLADDIEFFRELARFSPRTRKPVSASTWSASIQQLERALADELDYRIEARNAATFRRSLAEFPRILVPKVIEAYTTERVLTTERIRGMKIDEISPLVRIEHDFHPVADELTRAYLKQITIDGHFHADPHPGNMFVVLPRDENPWTPSEVNAIEPARRCRAPR